MDEIPADISEQMKERYSRRYRDLGYNVRTLGWGSTEQQRFRFGQTLRSMPDLIERSVLDIGCGFGDYFGYLNDMNRKPLHYTGWDINADLVGEAERLFEGRRDCSFSVVNLAESRTPAATADVTVMLGVLNLNLRDRFDNLEYSRRMITSAFATARELLIVDFLSSHLDPSYPGEDAVFYHDPAIMLEFALSLSADVVLHHDYPAIPQKEFMLFIRK